MSESDLAIMKREMMQSYIWLTTADGSIQRVEQEIAMFFPMICQEVVYKGLGTSKNRAISLPQQVNQEIFSLILDYCRFHKVPGRSNKERKIYDQKFIRMDSNMLRGLASAADSLQLKPLVDLTCRTLARTIEGRPLDEIREILNLPDDLTEEEKLEPLKNTMDDPGIRLLNRLNAKKRKELKERERLKNVEVEKHVVERSVDDLISFINGGDSKVVKTSKGKKKNKKKKDKKIVTSHEREGTKDIHDKGSHDLHSKQQGVEETGSSMREVEIPNLPSTEDDIFMPKAGSEDGYMDDEIDPVMKEMLDREVEEFARRLNSNWVESRGQERRPVQFSMNSNGTTRRHIGHS